MTRRVIIKNISPVVENGTYPAKAIVQDEIKISADIFADGHDEISAVLLMRPVSGTSLQIPMEFISNDKWTGKFISSKTGFINFRIAAWINHYESWRKGLEKKSAAGVDLAVDLKAGEALFDEYASYASKQERRTISGFRKKYISLKSDPAARLLFLRSISDYLQLIRNNKAVTISDQYEIYVEPVRSAFSTWYEMFPRSASEIPGRHGNFDDVRKRLPLVAEMGFDTLYLPPIHPIGYSFRKGRNNSLKALPEDVGSPWAIGNEEGGHKSIHRELGDMNNFKLLIADARKFEIEVALDIAFQCSPDHPYIKEHPQWFRWKPDGTIQYAENPPKKYEDIVPFDFESADWRQLWMELKSIIEFWIAAGVRVFRVDNPHTKSLAFWKWLLKRIHRRDPGIIFLAEAFTRPRIMEQLAMAGFNQSYTYFTWRITRHELEQYITELSTETNNFFRPNFWPNTPDILPPHLTEGGENAHLIRLILAATLSSNYGIYGPVFEYGLNEPLHGKEEYSDNEKYEVKHWDWNRYSKIREVITIINQVRRENDALQRTDNITILNSTNERIMCYAKKGQASGNTIIIVINLDPFQVHDGVVVIPTEIVNSGNFMVRDLLGGDIYKWNTGNNYVRLNPSDLPAHILRVEYEQG